MGYCGTRDTQISFPSSLRLSSLNFTLYINNDDVSNYLLPNTLIDVYAFIRFNDLHPSPGDPRIYIGSDYTMSTLPTGTGKLQLCDTININNEIPNPLLYTGNYTVLTFSDQDKIHAADTINNSLTMYPPNENQTSFNLEIFIHRFSDNTMIYPTYTVYGFV